MTTPPAKAAAASVQRHTATRYVSCTRPRPGRESEALGVFLYQGHPSDFTLRRISAQQPHVDSIVKEQSSGKAQAAPALKPCTINILTKKKGVSEGLGSVTGFRRYSDASDVGCFAALRMRTAMLPCQLK
ncbi:hypothetical protein COW36_21440 [bacterium (Candidatus Blackallbacteria) CG17_big_fil_post_rev_8_21_14_2_50_48_46]|uniref:Uncharacterized protein n=1 Tax=bacterium (Candidatus Blackallbacteria) CG17_big_fil_post_rev_8_21_14_2_50_48_46 TaxID=2014261 RepID=A0A2M7FZ08_9BACT|nr:MAG: hypothetical protein COW64_14740 [bacterium (Candidatus Blackallbacteria) CG18_big_fil_WC_8_21_14_2_50_49_26]PIW14603.1 MAG: hypothetical protein COW36_21440 [bacterium (Candidatus Blackallbacteria) CG17_big_fil_post_rev_8_21_14_2_50_48_46]PIW45654.1 MAG: hypothetical protein COW20_19270 [bacterium (Candidatus Blackallbacteria) CG13_big_fil_rev_8_21_14_2_50_49_14]